jgi:hypothetical protein
VSKKQKKSSPKAKETFKVEPRKPAAESTADPSLIPAVVPTAMPAPTPAGDKKRTLIRAIRITPEILEAAKVYRRATGISFYQLGLEAISERLTREGYLNRPAEPKP